MNLLRPWQDFKDETGFFHCNSNPFFNSLISVLSSAFNFIRHGFATTRSGKKKLNSRSVKIGSKVKEVIMVQHIILHIDDPVSTAIHVLLDNPASHFTVCEGRYIVGKITRKEIVEALAQHNTSGTVGDIMNGCHNMGNTIKYPPHFLCTPHQHLLGIIDIRYIIKTTTAKTRHRKHAMR